MTFRRLPKVTLLFVSYDRSVAVDPERRFVVAAAWDVPNSRPTIIGRESDPVRAAEMLERMAKFYGLEPMVIEPTQDTQTTIAVPRTRPAPPTNGVALGGITIEHENQRAAG